MKTTLLGLALILANALEGLAQSPVQIKNASRDYNFVVKGLTCGGQREDGDENKCSGPASIEIKRKQDHTLFQTLKLPNMEIYLDTASYNPSVNSQKRVLYGDEYSLIVEDFNFDGREDLAFCNGRDGGYGGPSYSVYLFSPTARRFVESRALSRLSEAPYLGLFQINKKEQKLTAFSKSGCCYHETEIYRMRLNRPVMIEKIIEDATGEMEVTTTRKLIHGKWVVKTRRAKLKR